MAAYEPRAITYVTHMKCISNRHHMTTQVQQFLHKCPGGFMCTRGHSPWMQPFPGWAPCGATHIAGASTRLHILRTAIQRSALRAREENSNSVLGSFAHAWPKRFPWTHKQTLTSANHVSGHTLHAARDTNTSRASTRAD
eukprot:4589075-Prymnesium_polylepis.1